VFESVSVSVFEFVCEGGSRVSCLVSRVSCA
jgi:hypothetical protein